MAENQQDYLDSLLRHIDNVRENCILLGKRLIENEELELGKTIIARGNCHDQSKFYGIEWEFMKGFDKEKLKIAIAQHNKTNDHHPEWWVGGIKEMSSDAIGEMVCDWRSRSSEMGTNLKEWVDSKATERWGFTKNTQVYKEIMKFINLLLEKPFKKL